MTKPFWETKSLSEMSSTEWESLCDGCGLCCLIRFEDEDSGAIIPTRVHCKLFDSETCGCSDYANRQKYVPDCLKLTPDMIGKLSWLPLSCGYRRVHEGRGLADWHPLVSGSRETVHTAGVSIQHQTISEELLVNEEDALDFEASDWLEERGA